MSAVVRHDPAYTPVAAAMIGESVATRALRALITKVAATPFPVLVQGETGVGKELVANALHLESRRRGNLVAFNVCAIADTMFEDALFGHVRGAFTGAFADSAGYLLEADRGTAFLDEIGGLSLGMQAKLLRAIETKEFRPVGARMDRRSDFRLVATTNVPLMDLVEQRLFRADLAHRLSTLVINVPPLRERVEDVPALAYHFAERATAGVQPVDLTACAMRVLQQHDWPGNVRELRGVVERAVTMAMSSSVDGPTIAALLARTAGPSHLVERHAAARDTLVQLLVAYEGDTRRVAAELSVSRGEVYRRMDQWRIPTMRRAGRRPPDDQDRRQ